MKRLKFLLLSVSILFLLVVVVYVSIAVYVGRHATLDSKKKSDVILVLGARSYINGSYNPCLVARVSHAVELYEDHYAPRLLFSGGNDTEDNANEAETMEKIAVGEGASKSAMLLEKKATSTYENLLFAKDIMQKNDLHTVLIVTEPFHAPRAALVADKLGMDYTISPAMKSSCWLPNKYLSKYFLKEPLAILEYKLTGKL